MDVDLTITAQLLLVVIAVVIASQTLLKPFLRTMFEREARIEGARGQADALLQEARELNGECSCQISLSQKSICESRDEQIRALRLAVEKDLLTIRQAAALRIQSDLRDLEASEQQITSELDAQNAALASYIQQQLLQTNCQNFNDLN